LATKKLTAVVIDALEDIKARDIKLVNVSKLTSVFDYIAIASADSSRQTKALAKNVLDKVKESGGWIYGIEGEQTGEWVLVDCGDVVVHIMQPAVREHYKLEELWSEGTLEFPKPAAPKRKTIAPAALPKTKAVVKKKPAAKAKVSTSAKATSKTKPKAKTKAVETTTAPKTAKVIKAKKPAVKAKTMARKTATKTVPIATKKIAPPAVKKTAAKKAAVKKPVAKKPVVKKVAAKKPKSTVSTGATPATRKRKTAA
jgi:ribosome-associated protein